MYFYSVSLPDGNPLELPVIELPARAVVLPHVGLGPHPGGHQAGAVLLTLRVQGVPVLFLQVHRHPAGNYHHLGQEKTTFKETEVRINTLLFAHKSFPSWVGKELCFDSPGPCCATRLESEHELRVNSVLHQWTPRLEDHSQVMKAL